MIIDMLNGSMLRFGSALLYKQPSIFITDVCIMACFQVPEFQRLPISNLEDLAVVLTENVYPPKSVIYYQGNEVEDMFFVFKGSIKVRNPHLLLCHRNLAAV